MHKNCSSCSKEWQERYELAVNSFNKQLKKAIAVSIVAICAAIFCAVIAAMCVAKTLKFISSFEYIEETEYQITQEDGVNTAIIGDKNEVKTNGQPDSNCRSDNQKNY